MTSFLNEVDEELQCAICRLPLREAVQTRCGHRFCKTCLHEDMKRRKRFEYYAASSTSVQQSKLVNLKFQLSPYITSECKPGTILVQFGRDSDKIFAPKIVTKLYQVSQPSQRQIAPKFALF